MANEVWKGYSESGVAVTDAGVKVEIPNGDHAFVCSVDSEGPDNIRAVPATEFADITTNQGALIRIDKAYTFVSRTDNQRMRFVTLYCEAGETAVANVSFS